LKNSNGFLWVFDDFARVFLCVSAIFGDVTNVTTDRSSSAPRLSSGSEVRGKP
jgi:hypothetical protein